MCEYSLMGVPNRLAKEEEELVVYSFPTGSKGMASPEELAAKDPKSYSTFWQWLKRSFSSQDTESVTAICVPPGARLTLRDIPVDIQRSLNVAPTEDVIFVQLNLDEYSYRDGVRFGNGTEISLQFLSDGQRLTVLSLDLETKNDPLHIDSYSSLQTKET